ncbi:MULTISPECIES: DNA-deoxyinosine glycosylase [Hyphomicrobiales]|uniref:DNA-deoxyinosine glycosylase n=1 Tax=Hyphomicrobiales TaxID=356 RepID=UPI002D793159|nr:MULTISPECIES: DNA-deoxyinosine glycosylase [Hyphomicrobiales]HET6388282.1 DNA-deoxyinosine glycosylase [Hyphomicrobium sp.]
MAARNNNVLLPAESRPVIKYSFPPIGPSGAHLLILGTLPGEESLRLKQYYGHPRNHFWPIMAALSGKPLPLTYEERVALLEINRWAVWDVLEGAERIGSADAAIRNPIANAFGAYFAENPAIRSIAFNGQKARDLFRRFVLKPGTVAADDFTMIELPSSSPLYTKTLDEKLTVWRDKLTPYTEPAGKRQELRVK